jgi:hypothetical protein
MDWYPRLSLVGSLWSGPFVANHTHTHVHAETCRSMAAPRCVRGDNGLVSSLWPELTDPV